RRRPMSAKTRYRPSRLIFASASLKVWPYANAMSSASLESLRGGSVSQNRPKPPHGSMRIVTEPGHLAAKTGKSQRDGSEKPRVGGQPRPPTASLGLEPVADLVEPEPFEAPQRGVQILEIVTGHIAHRLDGVEVPVEQLGHRIANVVALVGQPDVDR